MHRLMKISFPLIALFAFCCGFYRCTSDDKGPRVLIFNKTEFYFHESTAAGTEALEQLCRDNGLFADVTDDAETFTEDNLRKYAAVVFLNTAGDVLNYKQEAELERYIQAGGGFVGIHTAIDTEHNWKWYGKLIGAQFDGSTEVQKASLQVQDNEHPATKHLGADWQHQEEWFNLKNIGSDVNVLLTLDENSCQGGTMGNFHPVSWYHDFEGGRAFVTALGHLKEAYSDPAFLKHLLGGLQYAVGNNQPLDYNKPRPAASATTTGGTGFVKTSVVCDLYEPMEMDMFPDGKILFIERRGAIKLYDPATGRTSLLDEIAVYHQNEEGLLGLAIDPHWQENNWIYLYYAPEDEKESAIRLSRFIFKNDSLYRDSEKILLTVATDRTVHNYHAGGSLQFDAEGYLYLSTGDNTDHYDDGYSSLDERPGKSQYDSQKSASNSMDLRGKILRIKPLPDGSYLCPAGNLYNEKDLTVSPGAQHLLHDPLWEGIAKPWASGPKVSIAADFVSRTGATVSGKGRPEIFVMGCRNPFRISYDNRTKTLYWGEPGPDAGVPDSARGPEGYDEINAARTAGYYGWPYLVANNRPYRDYHYETDQAGPYFDPQHLKNDSPNNTGEKNLPPARPALIWYPFKSSSEFPLVANGTRCAMAGPVYYCDQYPAETRFPDQYNGKLIIYEWMRGWMLAVALDSLGNYQSMEPFADNLRVSRPIDMLIDKKGALWVLEYGTEWYSANPDACLSRIDYVRGTGQTAQASAPLTPPVRWDFGNKNRSFYQPGDVVPYKVVFSDPNTADPTALDIAIEYKETDQNPHVLAQKYRPAKTKNEFERGQTLINGSDCKSCHAVDRQINGPAYLAISARYSQDKSALAKLTEKIIKGGSGVWGTQPMIAHPQLAPKDINEMVRWILSLQEQAKKAVAPQGRYTLTAPGTSGTKGQGVFIFSAFQQGSGGETVVLRPVVQQAEKADSCSKGLRTYKRPLNATTTVMTELKNQQFLVFKRIDLRGIKSLAFAAETSGQNKHAGGGTLELRLDGPTGRLAGTVTIPAANPGNAGLTELTLPVDQAAWPSDGTFHDIYVLVKNEGAGDKPVLGVDWVRFGL